MHKCSAKKTLKERKRERKIESLRRAARRDRHRTLEEKRKLLMTIADIELEKHTRYKE